ncbi:hypothetical protein MMC30_000384 [Trapelia coarctata]|nr:hypothetical protein [Trapelia coarctata]
MPPSTADPFETLRTTLVSTKALISRFESQIQIGSLPLTPLDPSSPNALALFSDAGAVLKAQTTKLSLLVLNKPFCPKEITFILKALCNECIPALVSACQLCPRISYTNFLHRIIRSTVGSSFKLYLGILDEIPVDKAGAERIQRQKTLNSTGMLWESLDFMTKLGKEGITGVAAGKIEGNASLLKDAIEELEEWETGEVESNDIIEKKLPPEWQEVQTIDRKAGRTAGIELNEDIGTNNLSKMEGNPFDLPQAADASVQPITKKVIKALKLVVLLYPPILKRRVRRFPEIDATTNQEAFPTKEQVENFDCMLLECQSWTDIADEIAEALYMHDEDDVERILKALKGSARKCIGHVLMSWDGKEDEFTAWADKWLVKLDEI